MEVKDLHGSCVTTVTYSCIAPEAHWLEMNLLQRPLMYVLLCVLDAFSAYRWVCLHLCLANRLDRV